MRLAYSVANAAATTTTAAAVATTRTTTAYAILLTFEKIKHRNIY